MRGLRRFWPFALALLAAAGFLAWLAFPPRPSQVVLDKPRESMAPIEPGAAAAPRPLSRPASAAPPAAAAPAEPAGESPDDADGVPDPKSAFWSSIDLERIHAAMPDNLYFELSAPTQDPQVEERRAAEREQWNVQYGKILSGTATEEEIRGYYDQRARLSGDYIEFASYLLDNYGNDLPEQDVGLLELARRLHRARLEEIPRKMEEALERKDRQDAARAAWLADEKAFAESDPRSE